MKFELTKGSLLKQIFTMSFSMGIGMLSVIGFNLADTYFIGKLGDTELAAISLTFPVIMFFFGLTFGTATAVTTIVSRAIGEKDFNKARRYSTDSLSFAHKEETLIKEVATEKKQKNLYTLLFITCLLALASLFLLYHYKQKK